MARAIAGSGSYQEPGGQPARQVQVLTGWLREGRDSGYPWLETYQQIYDSWSKYRPLFPPPSEMAELVEKEPPTA